MPRHSTRAHAVLSASSAHRWLNCPASAVASTLYPSKDTPYTLEGTLAHETAEAAIRGIDYPDKANKEMIRHADDYAAFVREHIADPEMSLQLIEARVDFSEWVPNGFGTCDALIINGDEMIVIDYKYGAGHKVDADDNPQMKLYALGAYNDYGFIEDVKTVKMIIYQPRMDNISEYETSIEALLEWAEDIVKPTAQKATSDKGEYHAGSHCLFCPHAGACRELMNTCTTVVKLDGVKHEVSTLAPWETAMVLENAPLIELWLRSVKQKALNDALDGKPMEGYKVVAGRMGNRSWSDELEVLKVLEKEGVDREDVMEVKLLSPAAMTRVLGKARAEELLSGLILRAEGKPELVRESDPRPVYNRLEEAQKDFT